MFFERSANSDYLARSFKEAGNRSGVVVLSWLLLAEAEGRRLAPGCNCLGVQISGFLILAGQLQFRDRVLAPRDAIAALANVGRVSAHAAPRYLPVA